jgi:SAM-dependent methyltransferase
MNYRIKKSKDNYINSPQYGNVKHFYEKCYADMPFNPNVDKSSKIIHNLMERPLREIHEIGILLELGAGLGEHRIVSKLHPKLYIESDISIHSSRHERNFVQIDAINIPAKDKTIDVILATCLVAHLNEVEGSLTEWRRAIKLNGKIVFYVPTEPSLSLNMIRKVWTARKARKLGFFGYKLYIARDHINSYSNIIEIAKYVFRNDTMKVRKYPFRLLPWWLNLFSIVEVKIKNN